MWHYIVNYPDKINTVVVDSGMPKIASYFQSQQLILYFESFCLSSAKCNSYSESGRFGRILPSIFQKYWLIFTHVLNEQWKSSLMSISSRRSLMSWKQRRRHCWKVRSCTFVCRHLQAYIKTTVFHNCSCSSSQSNLSSILLQFGIFAAEILFEMLTADDWTWVWIWFSSTLYSFEKSF